MFEWILIVFIVILINLLPSIHANFLALLLAPYFSPLQIAFALGLHFILSIVPSLLYSISPEVAAAPLINKLAQHDKNKTILIFLISALASSSLSILIPEGFFSFLSRLLKPYIPYIVTVLSIYFFLNLKINSKIMFILTGIWGLLILNDKYFLPLFTGLFAIPFLLYYEKPTTQRFHYSEPKFLPHSIFLGFLVGIFSLLLPGVSPPSVISILVPFFKGYDFLSYYVSISSAQYILSINNYLDTGKIRNGYVVFIKHPNAPYFLILGMMAGALILFPLKIKTPESKWLRYFILTLLTITVFLLTSLEGLAILLGSSILGILAYKTKASQPSLLGSLIVPTLYLLTRNLF